MAHNTGDGPGRYRATDVLGRLEKMVQAGRLEPEDAARVRAAAESGGLDDVIDQIRLRHAKGRVRSAVDAGRLAQEDAERILERLDAGEDPRFVLRGGLGSGRSGPEGGEA